MSNRSSTNPKKHNEEIESIAYISISENKYNKTVYNKHRTIPDDFGVGME